MKTNEAAKILRERIKVAALLDSKTREKLGQDGVKLSLNKGWLVVDESFSALAITTNATKLAQMLVDAEGNVEEVLCERKDNSRDFAVMHSVSHDSASPFFALQEREKFNDAAKALPLVEDDEAPKIGEDVIVVEAGQTYQATVQAVKPDGSCVLSFGDKKPATVKPSYQKDELGKVAKVAGAPAAPKSTGSGSTTTPSASGLSATVPAAVANAPRAPGIGR